MRKRREELSPGLPKGEEYPQGCSCLEGKCSWAQCLPEGLPQDFLAGEEDIVRSTGGWPWLETQLSALIMFICRPQVSCGGHAEDRAHAGTSQTGGEGSRQ